MNTLKSGVGYYTNLPKLVYLYGFGMWLTIITINNISDPLTNIIFIERMVSMSLFVADSNIGSGLRWRAIDVSWLPVTLFWLVVIAEVIVDILMWIAFVRVLRQVFRKQALSQQCLNSINLALSAYMLLFFTLITGGMWFGYWIYQGAFQMVHLTAIIISLLGLIYFNQAQPVKNQ